MTSSANPLGWLDFLVMSMLLTASVAVGLYHGLVKGGQKSLNSFFFADKSVFSLPVAMTLMASFVSPITILGVPAEIYTYGGQYLVFILMLGLMYPLLATVFVPFFYGLDITTAYQYLHLRFSLSLRILGASIFIVQTCFYMAIVIYAPALAIEAVTQLNLWVVVLITGIVCIFYTTLGGMKAVIWTDVLMFFVIFITSILVIVMGTIEAGGVSYVWKINKDMGRLDIFAFPIDPTVRMTFLNVLFGTMMNSLPLWAIGQTAVQRYLSAKSLKDAKISVWLNLPMVVGITGITCFQGLVLYAFYNGDSAYFTSTIETGSVAPSQEPRRSPPNLTKSDQILMYFVSEQFGHIPGYQGLFISCVFAGSLSTVSSGLNAIVAVALIDIIRPFRHWQAKRSEKEASDDESRDTIKSKILTLGFGVLTLVLAFFSTNIGTIISLIQSFLGALGGPLVAAFLLGMFWPRANARGVLLGTICSLFLGVWMSAGAFLTAGQEDKFGLYKVSFNWYATFTIALSVLVSVLASELFQYFHPVQKKIDPMLLSSLIRAFYGSESAAVPGKEGVDIVLESFDKK